MKKYNITPRFNNKHILIIKDNCAKVFINKDTRLEIEFGSVITDALIHNGFLTTLHSTYINYFYIERFLLNNPSVSKIDDILFLNMYSTVKPVYSEYLEIIRVKSHLIFAPKNIKEGFLFDPIENPTLVSLYSTFLLPSKKERNRLPSLPTQSSEPKKEERFFVPLFPLSEFFCWYCSKTLSSGERINTTRIMSLDVNDDFQNESEKTKTNFGLSKSSICATKDHKGSLVKPIHQTKSKSSMFSSRVLGVSRSQGETSNFMNEPNSVHRVNWISKVGKMRLDKTLTKSDILFLYTPSDKGNTIYLAAFIKSKKLLLFYKNVSSEEIENSETKRKVWKKDNKSISAVELFIPGQICELRTKILSLKNKDENIKVYRSFFIRRASKFLEATGDFFLRPIEAPAILGRGFVETRDPIEAYSNGTETLLYFQRDLFSDPKSFRIVRLVLRESFWAWSIVQKLRKELSNSCFEDVYFNIYDYSSYSLVPIVERLVEKDSLRPEVLNRLITFAFSLESYHYKSILSEKFPQVHQHFQNDFEGFSTFLKYLFCSFVFTEDICEKIETPKVPIAFYSEYSDEEARDNEDTKAESSLFYNPFQKNPCKTSQLRKNTLSPLDLFSARIDSFYNEVSPDFSSRVDPSLQALAPFLDSSVLNLFSVSTPLMVRLKNAKEIDEDKEKIIENTMDTAIDQFLIKGHLLLGKALIMAQAFYRKEFREALNGVDPAPINSSVFISGLNIDYNINFSKVSDKKKSLLERAFNTSVFLDYLVYCEVEEEGSIFNFSEVEIPEEHTLNTSVFIRSVNVDIAGLKTEVALLKSLGSFLKTLLSELQVELDTQAVLRLALLAPDMPKVILLFSLGLWAVGRITGAVRYNSSYLGKKEEGLEPKEKLDLSESLLFYMKKESKPLSVAEELCFMLTQHIPIYPGSQYLELDPNVIAASCVSLGLFHFASGNPEISENLLNALRNFPDYANEIKNFKYIQATMEQQVSFFLAVAIGLVNFGRSEHILNTMNTKVLETLGKIYNLGSKYEGVFTSVSLGLLFFSIESSVADVLTPSDKKGESKESSLPLFSCESSPNTKSMLAFFSSPEVNILEKKSFVANRVLCSKNNSLRQINSIFLRAFTAGLLDTFPNILGRLTTYVNYLFSTYIFSYDYVKVVEMSGKILALFFHIIRGNWEVLYGKGKGKAAQPAFCIPKKQTKQLESLTEYLAFLLSLSESGPDSFLDEGDVEEMPKNFYKNMGNRESIRFGMGGKYLKRLLCVSLLLLAGT